LGKNIQKTIKTQKLIAPLETGSSYKPVISKSVDNSVDKHLNTCEFLCIGA